MKNSTLNAVRCQNKFSTVARNFLCIGKTFSIFPERPDRDTESKVVVFVEFQHWEHSPVTYQSSAEEVRSNIFSNFAENTTD